MHRAAPADAAHFDERRHGGASARAVRVGARFDALRAHPFVADHLRDQQFDRQVGGEIFALSSPLRSTVMRSEIA